MYTDSDVQEQSRENFYLSTFGVLKKINLLRDITHHSNKPNFKDEKCQILFLKTCLLLQTVTTTPGLKSIEEKKSEKATRSANLTNPKFARLCNMKNTLKGSHMSNRILVKLSFPHDLHPPSGLELPCYNHCHCPAVGQAGEQ